MECCSPHRTAPRDLCFLVMPEGLQACTYYGILEQGNYAALIVPGLLLFETGHFLRKLTLILSFLPSPWHVVIGRISGRC